MKTRTTGAISLTLVLAMLLSMVSPALATEAGGNNSENIVITNTTVNGVTYDSGGNPVTADSDISEPADVLSPESGTDAGKGDTNTPTPETPTEPVEKPDVSQAPVTPSDDPKPAPSEDPVAPSEPVEKPDPVPSPDVTETPSPVPSEPVEGDEPDVNAPDEILPEESSLPEISLMSIGSMDVNSGKITLTPGVSTLSGSTTTYYVEANQAGNYTVTLSNATINTTNKDDQPAIRLASGVNMTLILDGTNTVKSGVGAAGINVPAGATLTIQGTGSLTVNGGGSGDSTASTASTRQESGAGIGGNYNQACGNIIINSGTVVATGGYKPYYGAAGIGGGSAKQGTANHSDTTGVAGKIEINGGNVSAYGSKDCQYGAAGIGGGSLGNGRNITITAGSVTAEGSEKSYYGASGIGGGMYGHGHDIMISGGTVTATVSQLATTAGAGIGAGSNGNGYNITISGGTVKTVASTSDSLSGAAIGGGGGFGADGGMGADGELASMGHGYNINISGGTLNLQANTRGAGIGGGSGGYGEDITITGGNITVSHVMGRSKGGAGIGGGSDGYGRNIIINGLTPITLNVSAGYGGAGIGGGSYGNGENIEITGDVNITQSYGYDGGAGIGGGSYRDGKDINIHGALVRAYFISSSSSSSLNGAGIGGGIGHYGINISISDCTAENGSKSGYAIRADGGTYGAGIGTGYIPGAGYTDIGSVVTDVPDDFNVLTNIKILNSNVYVTAGSHGAAIGTGQSGSNSAVNRYASVDIDGGTIYASGSTYGSGIGTGGSTSGRISNNIRFSVRFDINIKNVTNFQASGYYGAGIGSGQNSNYCDFNVSMSECDDVTVRGRGYNSVIQSPSGIGTGWNSDYTNFVATIDDIKTFTATAEGAGAGAIGTGSEGTENNVSFVITNVGTLSARNTYSTTGSSSTSNHSGTGIGLGYSADNSTAKFVVHDVDHIIVPSGGNTGIGSGGYNTNCVSDYDIYDIGDIKIDTSVLGIGAGINEHGTDAEFTMKFARVGGITVKVNGSYVASGIGTGYNNHDNVVDLVFDDCGVIDSQLTSSSTNTWYSTRGAAIGVGGDTYNSDVSLRFLNTGNIIAKAGPYQSTSIGTGTDVRNTKTDIYMRPKVAGSSITAAVNYYGMGIGAGPRNYGSSSSNPYGLKIDIADYTSGIRIDLNLHYATGIGIGYNSYSTGVGLFESNIALNNCGSIAVTANGNYQQVTGIGTGSSAYGPFDNNISVSNMPGGIILNLGNSSSDYWSYTTGVGTGLGVCNSTANSEQKTDIDLINIGDISVTGSGLSTGIGTGAVNYTSTTAKITNTITISEFGNITTFGVNTATGIGIGAGSQGVAGKDFFKTTIMLSDGGDITTKSAYRGTGIGVSGYSGANNTNAHSVNADIQIIDCGNIIANGSANTSSNSLNYSIPYGVGIGIGSDNYNSNSSSQADGDIKILFQDVKSVTATGSRYGAAIGTSGNTYYTTGLTVDIKTTDDTVIPIVAIAGEFASAIGAGHNNHGSGVKADIKITNANISAVSGKAAPIGVGQAGDGGETKITLTNCVIDQAETSDGPALGISRGTTTNGAKLTAVLNNVTGNFNAGGYAAGMGVGANCIAAQMDLTLNNSTITAVGADGGAGIGTGPLNTGCTLKLRADSSEITATGSGTNKTEFDVVGSKNNDILDDLAKANILGAGAGIGGSKGPQGLDIEFLDSIVIATGGGVNDYCAAGIGSGRQGDSGKITITGGEVTATGGQSETEGAAGIGSGTAGKVGTITINSGVVKAYGSNGTKLGGAGIGSGADSTGSGVIIINDGEVYAYGSERGAGIGGGSRGSGALVTINGGKVYAKGGLFDTAGIGGGTVPQGDTDTEKHGVLTITDANGYPDIHAYGSSYALAITSDIITNDSVRILQGTLLNVPTEDTDLTVKRLADGRDGDAVAVANLPANYDAFSLTLPQGDADGTEYNVYMDVQENGLAETYLLATPEQVENFPVSKSEFYAAKQLNIVKFFTVEFDTNGGSVIESQLVRISGIPTVPENPTRMGYVFAGWYADPDCETMFDFSNPIEADAKVYANWIEGEGVLYEIHHYKQTLDKDYAIGNIEYAIGKPGDTVTAVRKTYEGFNYVKDHANAVTSGVLVENGEKLVLKLYYDRKIITVQFVNIENDSSFASSMSAPWGTSILLGTPSKMYYDFDKWTKLDADGEMIPMIPTRIETMGPVLYANWILKNGAEYQVKHYQRQLDGNYICVLIEQYANAVGSEVQAVYKDYEGFTVNESISTEASKGIAQADNSTVLKVYYDRNKITVKLLDTYMPTMTEQTREYGALANLPIPSRDGYAFAGWYTDDDELVTNDMTINDLGEQVTAKWTAGADIVYSVRYFLQDSTGEYKISEYYSLRGQAGNEVKIEPKTLQGYTFEPDMSNLVGVIKGDGSLSLDLYYSILTYKVSFESNGGTAIPSQDAVYYGGVITPVTDPVKTGYIFDGWYVDEGCEIEFNVLQPILGETVLYAKWLPGMSEYHVQHWVETQDGTGYRMVNEEILTGVTDSIVIAQLKNYDGCSENINHPDRISTGKVSSAGDLVLKVYYSRKPVTVIYETLGGEAIEDVVLKYGDTADDLTAIRAGYDFAGWYTNISLTKKFDFSTNLQKDLTLYAKWTPRSDTAYTVEYYWQNPDMPAMYELHETKDFTGRTEAAVHAKIEKYDGLVQNEDYHDSNVVGIITGDGSLVLRVYYDREECLVSFETNGGKAVPVATVLFDGHLVPKATTKTGYDFAGWYKDEDLTMAWDNVNDTVTEDMTLYALWTAAEGTAYQVQHWTQNIDLDGYELNQTEPFTGTTDEMATASAIEIYGFAENEDTDLRVVEGEIKPDGSLVLKVYYDRVTFDVSFETDGGTEIDTASVLYEKKLTKPTDPKKTGYIFDGWYKDETFVMAYDFDSKVIEDMRVYAKYKPASGVVYTVQRWIENVEKTGYILGSEEELAGTTGETVSVLKKDIDGFTANGNGILSGTVAADGSLVLTMFYNRNDYTVTFDAQNGDENSTKDVTYGATFECPVVTKTGYEFLGWFDKNGVEIKPEYTMPACDLDLFAHWKAALGTAYKTEHWVQDITGTDYELESTDELTGQTDSLATAEYKTYDGFTAQEDNEAMIKSGYIVADGSLVLKLYYTRNQYSVGFVTNCNQVLDSQVVYFKAHATDPGELTKTGYVFEGWYVDPEFKTPVNFDIMPVVQNMTLYGKWASADDTGYKTRHYIQDVNGEGYSLKETIDGHGTTDALATAIPQSYYGFVENENHKDRIPEAVIQSDGSTVLALYYDRLDYEVSFETNGGNEIKPQTVKYEASLAPVQDPVKPGYVFDGWYSDILLTMPADLTIQSVTENRTYYAKYMAAEGTAYKTEYWTMGLDGNYALKAFEMSYGDTDLAVTANVKPIPGFQHNPDAAGSNLAGVILPDGSLVLKVYYDRLSYVLTVDADNGDETQTREVLFENAIGELPEVSKSGYDFAGWYDEENREIDNLTAMPAHDMTVKAHWNKQPDIVFPPSGGGGGGGTVRTYEIKILVNEGGVTDPNEAKVKVTSGKDQTVRIIPDAGYKILNVFVDGKDMGDISEFKFEKVKADHEIQITFAHICYIEDYSDVDLNAWYHENLDWGVANGFFKGYDQTHMAPCGKLTRAEAAQVVARMYDYQSDSGVLARIMMKAMFSDVSLEAWYASAVQYDNAKGYLIGYGDGKFGPQDNLTREQMAQLLYRLAGKPEVILDDKKRLADMDKISDWAQPAMDWAIQNEIVVGDDRRFVRPQDAISRAEAAAMFQRFQELDK